MLTVLHRQGRVSKTMETCDGKLGEHVENLLAMLKQAHYSLQRLQDEVLAPAGLTAGQWMTIALLSSHKANSPLGLANLCAVDAGSMTRLLDRLEAKGFLSRMRSTEDRRVVNIELTCKGEAAAQRLPNEIARVLGQHLRGFRDEEIAQLCHYLKRVIANSRTAR